MNLCALRKGVTEIGNSRGVALRNPRLYALYKRGVKSPERPIPAQQGAPAHPDLDAGPGGSAEPVAVGAEAQGVDDVTAVQRVQVLALVQVPQHGLAVLGEERASDGERVPLPHPPHNQPASSLQLVPRK